jgi:hypothetical protein
MAFKYIGSSARRISSLNELTDPEANSPQLEDDEYSTHSYSTTAFEEALCQRNDSSPSPSPNPVVAVRVSNSRAFASRRPEPKDNVQRERKFKYSGPDNEVENWYRDFPASLPFPKTLMMAHWKSLKIDYDLSRLDQDIIVEKDVPLHHEQLQSYFNLDQYESGSRFKLPKVSKEDQETISRYGTAQKLNKVVDDFYQLTSTQDGVKPCAPHMFLEQFEVGYQSKYFLRHTIVGKTNEELVAPRVHLASFSQIRRSMNVSPSPQIRPIPTKRTSLAPSEGCIYKTDNAPVVRSEINLTDSLPRPRATLMARSSHGRSSPAFRRISKAVRRARSASLITEQAASSSKPGSGSDSTTTRLVTHVATPKRNHGRPCKTSLPVVSNPPNPSSSLGKRKPSTGSQFYTPPTSSMKKVLRDAKKLKTSPRKMVGLIETLEDDSEDPNYPASPAKRPARNKTTAGRSKGIKATTAAEKHARNEKGRRRGTTRSGVIYK